MASEQRLTDGPDGPGGRTASASPLTLSHRYTLDHPLGRGGMADVYRGHDDLLDRSVAVKIFRAGSGGAGNAIRQESEMRVLGQLHHPNLVTLWDAGVDGHGPFADRFFLVMELVDGPTLAQRIAAGPLPLPEVADLGAQLADGLAYIHERGIVHRDVKPANVLLAGSQIKLTDFGIARIVDGTRYTDEGTTIGTPDYLSPEQVTGTNVDLPTDIYALGLMLIESITGRRCYSGTPVECAIARLSRPPEVPAELSPAWRGLLTAMTASDPAERPAAANVARALRAIRVAAGVPDAETTTLPALGAEPDSIIPFPADTPARESGLASERAAVPPRPPHRILRRTLVAAAVLVGLGGAGTALLAGNSSGPAAVDARAAAPATSAPAAPAQSSAPEPAYPSVPGAAGFHLAALEADLHGVGGVAGARLRADALGAAQSLAVNDLASAAMSLAQLRSDLASAGESGAVSASSTAAIEQDLNLLAGDLATAQAQASAASARSAAAAAPTVTRTVTAKVPAPQPAAPRPTTTAAQAGSHATQVAQDDPPPTSAAPRTSSAAPTSAPVPTPTGTPDNGGARP